MNGMKDGLFVKKTMRFAGGCKDKLDPTEIKFEDVRWSKWENKINQSSVETEENSLVIYIYTIR